jgi:hypothetical protein
VEDEHDGEELTSPPPGEETAEEAIVSAQQQQQQQQQLAMMKVMMMMMTAHGVNVVKFVQRLRSRVSVAEGTVGLRDIAYALNAASDLVEWEFDEVPVLRV